MFSPFTLKSLSPADVKAGLDDRKIVLVDVREPDEHKAERIAGAINVPLSALATAELPAAGEKTLVMHCQGGVRSAKAVDICRKRGLAVGHHLGGGIAAWKAHGQPTVK